MPGATADRLRDNGAGFQREQPFGRRRRFLANGVAVAAIAFTLAFLSRGVLAFGQGIDGGTVIHQCKIKGFHPGMTRHEKVRLLAERYGDEILAKDACYRSEAEFTKYFNLDPGEAKSLYAPECRAANGELVLEPDEVGQVFGACMKGVEQFTRDLAFATGIYFQRDGDTGAYYYVNAKDKCAVTIDKDLRLTLSRPAPLGQPQGKK